MLKNRLSTLFSLLLIGSANAATLGADNCRVILPAEIEVADETVNWNGPCVNGYAEGDGTLLRYVKKQQVGSFEGRMAQGMLAEGYEKSPEGWQYEGQYKRGLRHGKGTWIDDTGTRYDGEWQAGMRDGMGTINFSLGGRYEGPWSADKPSGLGKVTYAGGQRIESGVPFPEKEPAPADDRSAKTFRVSKKSTDESQLDRFASSRTSSRFVPFDKNFAQMAPEEQARIRRIYPLLHPDDTPPYPENGTDQIFQWLRTAQGEIFAEGKLRTMVDVDANGKATAVTIFESPEEKMAELIKLIFFHQKFIPAQCGGKPCAMRYAFSVDFLTSLPRHH